MSTAPRFEQLKQLTDQQLRDCYDHAVGHTVVGTGFYIDELRRRNYERVMRATNNLARRTFWLSVVNGGFALVAAVAAIVALSG